MHTSQHILAADYFEIIPFPVRFYILLRKLILERVNRRKVAKHSIMLRQTKSTPKGNKINCLRHLYDLFYQPQIFPQESNLMLNDACQDKKKFIFLASCTANLVDWKLANQSTTKELFTFLVNGGRERGRTRHKTLF